MLEGFRRGRRRLGWQVGHAHLGKSYRGEFEHLRAAEFILAIHVLQIVADRAFVALIRAANLASRVTRDAAGLEGNTPFGFKQQIGTAAIKRGTGWAYFGAGGVVTVSVAMTA